MKSGNPIKILLPGIVLCAIVVVIFWPSKDEPQQQTKTIELTDSTSANTQTTPANKVIRTTSETTVQTESSSTASEQTPVVEQVSESVSTEPELTAPLKPAPEVKPLPDPNESDSALKKEMSELPNGTKLINLLVDSELIRKGVRAIHAISEGTVVKEYRPVTSAPGSFLANESEVKIDTKKTYRIDTKNFNRYNNHLKVLTAIPPEAAADLYSYYYPLLQQAYDELGLPQEDFLTVTHRALENFIEANQATPNLLMRPSVMFIYAEKNAEQASGVQKLLWRMGTENADKLQTWITEFKQALSAQ